MLHYLLSIDLILEFTVVLVSFLFSVELIFFYLLNALGVIIVNAALNLCFVHDLLQTHGKGVLLKVILENFLLPQLGFSDLVHMILLVGKRIEILLFMLLLEGLRNVGAILGVIIVHNDRGRRVLRGLWFHLLRLILYSPKTLIRLPTLTSSWYLI